MENTDPAAPAPVLADHFKWNVSKMFWVESIVRDGRRWPSDSILLPANADQACLSGEGVSLSSQETQSWLFRLDYGLVIY